MSNTVSHTVFFDGACEPVNPGGVATWGIVVYKDNNLIHTDCGIAGNPFSSISTNNFAEYSALIKAIEYCFRKGIKRILVKGDSQLVIKQMTGEYSVRSACILPLYIKASGYIKKFETIIFKWIPRKENQEADRLSKKAYADYIASINPDNIVLPFGRFKGRTIFWVKKHRPQYIEWLANQTWPSPELKKILHSVEQLDLNIVP